MAIKITTIITSLNTKETIAHAIESFLQQDYEHKELIIVDGKSTDGTCDIIRKYINLYPKLIIWINSSDTGIHNARNIAVRVATGDIIGFLGADDLLHKDIYTKLSYYSLINYNYDVIYFKFMLIFLSLYLFYLIIVAIKSIYAKKV